MKVCGQGLQVTLTVKGREIIFSERELISIVEEHLERNTSKYANTTKVAQKPTEGEWFEVKPKTIDRKLFQERRENERQESTRNLILEAFDEMDNKPWKYGENFKTMFPMRTLLSSTVAGLVEVAKELGDDIADWVEQAMEWAQRISNGESWETICDSADKASWTRIVKWKNDCYRLVGGSSRGRNYFYCPPSDVNSHQKQYHYNDSVYDVVPLIVLYDE